MVICPDSLQNHTESSIPEHRKQASSRGMVSLLVTVVSFHPKSPKNVYLGMFPQGSMSDVTSCCRVPSCLQPP